MSFSFGFSDDDIEIDEQEKQSQQAHQNTTVSQYVNPLDEPIQGLEPKLHSLEEILLSLKDVPLTFSATETGSRNVVYKRELFDVKHQLMVEEDEENVEQETKHEFDALMGEDDLKKFIYEGGLKTWECSLDLVDKLQQQYISIFNDEEGTNVIELGSGTSLPTCYLFSQYLKSSQKAPVKFILSDYNRSVLRLVTVPNLIINWFTSLSLPEKQELQQTFKISADIEAELQVSEPLLTKFSQDLTSKNIGIQLISGSWSRQFLSIVDSVKASSSQHAKSLILTSETIYSTDVSPILAETLIALLANSQESVAIAAAKDIYFGVGGTVIEFLCYLDSKIKNNKKVNIQYNVEKVASSGLNRSLVTISNL